MNLWGHILYIEKEKREFIDNIFKEIQKEYNIVDRYSDCCIRELFQMLIIYLIRLDRSADNTNPFHTNNNPNNKIDSEMISAAKYIAENFKNNISLK